MGLWPIGINLKSYEYTVSDRKFARDFVTSLQRIALGFSVTMSLATLAAHPLSKTKEKFRAREKYVWFFLITIIFNCGLIPPYIVVQRTGLTNTICALVLPQAFPFFDVILLQGFFKALPAAIEESVFMDGAGHWKTLVSLYLPLSKPVLAALTLFVAVRHFNSWFDGLIYINSPTKYPLQSYLQTVVVNPDFATLSSVELRDMCAGVVAKNSKAATIFLAAAPIVVLFPFVQRYFIKGIVLVACRENKRARTEVAESLGDEAVLAPQIVGLRLEVFACSFGVRRPELLETAIRHRLVDVVAALVDDQPRAIVWDLRCKARVSIVLLVGENLVNFHGIDHSVAVSPPAEANDPVADLGRSSDRGFAGCERAATPKGIWRESRVMRENVRVDFHRRFFAEL